MKTNIFKLNQSHEILAKLNVKSEETINSNRLRHIHKLWFAIYTKHETIRFELENPISTNRT